VNRLIIFLTASLFSNEINAARVSASPVGLYKGNAIIEKIKTSNSWKCRPEKNAPLRTKETANQVHAATGRRREERDGRERKQSE
jgi:hypothetical protein